VDKYVLSEHKPGILFIPPGYANGMMTLSLGTKLLIFSSSTVQDSTQDDFRYPSRYWDAWDVEER